MATISHPVIVGIVSVLSTLPLNVNALTPAEVFDKVKDSVFVVKSFDEQYKPKSQGSAVLLPTGKLATNCHVVNEGMGLEVGKDNQFVPATLYAGNKKMDICLLDAEITIGKPVELGLASNLKVGVPVFAVGAPQGLELTLSDGIVSQLREGIPPIIQTTAAISPGSSGGGLFDSEGHLVGLTTLYFQGGQNLNFAVPAEWLSDLKPDKKTTSNKSNWLETAIVMERQKDWSALLKWSKRWVKSEPKNSIAWMSLGNAYNYLEHYKGAIDAYRQVLRIDPENVSAWYSLGVIYRDNQSYQEAIYSNQQALRINPEYVEAWYNLGVIFASIQRYQNAIDAYRQALRIDPELKSAWNNIGSAYDNSQRYQDAIDAFRQSLRINPEDAQAWYNLGHAYMGSQRYQDAIDASLQALRIDPEYASAWNILGLAYDNSKHYQDAIDAFQQALRINPKDVGAWNNLAITYLKTGNMSAALEIVKTLRPLDSKLADRLFNLIIPR